MKEERKKEGEREKRGRERERMKENASGNFPK